MSKTYDLRNAVDTAEFHIEPYSSNAHIKRQHRVEGVVV